MTNARTAKSAREKAAEMRAEAARIEARRRNSLVAAAVAAVLVVVVAVVIVVKTASRDQQAKVAAGTPSNLVNGGIVVGSTTAKVTIALYEDFQCPVCKSFEQGNASQLAAWAKDGTAKLEYHPVAILDRMSSTQYSTRALNAAAAVENSTPSAFQKFHDLLYANQPAENSAGLTDDRLLALAAQAGATDSAIRAAVTGHTYYTWAAAQTDEFSQKGYTGTPTVVINGTVLSDTAPDKLKAAVLKAAG